MSVDDREDGSNNRVSEWPQNGFFGELQSRLRWSKSGFRWRMARA
jgi:hypothetical protein